MDNKVIWITGLVDSGKTTIALALQKRIKNSIVLDANILREWVSGDLGFTREDRAKNILRTGGIAKILHDQGITVIAAIISPNEEDRQKVRSFFPTGSFIEVYNNTPVEICEQRDTKGLYKRQKESDPSNLNTTLPGSRSYYEPPKDPELTLNTFDLSLDECVEAILNYINFN